MPVFEKRTFIRTTPARLFAFHELPDALERLTPPWERVRVVERSGRGIAAGTRVTLEMALGPLRPRWVAEHVAYEPARLFRDVQRSGPFRKWEHTHLVEVAPGGALLVDHVEYELPFGLLGRLASRFVTRRLERLFEYRHEVTRRTCEEP